jgi:hypothetical protein
MSSLKHAYFSVKYSFIGAFYTDMDQQDAAVCMGGKCVGGGQLRSDGNTMVCRSAQ